MIDAKMDANEESSPETIFEAGISPSQFALSPYAMTCSFFDLHTSQKTRNRSAPVRFDILVVYPIPVKIQAEFRKFFRTPVGFPSDRPIMQA